MRRNALLSLRADEFKQQQALKEGDTAPSTTTPTTTSTTTPTTSAPSTVEEEGQDWLSKQIVQERLQQRQRSGQVAMKPNLLDPYVSLEQAAQRGLGSKDEEDEEDEEEDEPDPKDESVVSTTTEQSSDYADSSDEGEDDTLGRLKAELMVCKAQSEGGGGERERGREKREKECVCCM